MSNLQDKSIGDLEIRIFLANKVLEWLHSDDPMLEDPEWAPMVPMAKQLYSGQLQELKEALAKKKKSPEVQVGLKRAKLIARKL